MKKKIIWTIVIIALIALLIFLIVFNKSLTARIWSGEYCKKAINCTKCVDGVKECNFKIENDDGTFTISEDTIQCDCNN